MSGSGAPEQSAPHARGMRVTVVAAQWHERVMEGLVTGALRAIALQEAARHLPRIGQVNLAPDMLQSLLAGLLPRAEAEEGRS